MTPLHRPKFFLATVLYVYVNYRTRKTSRASRLANIHVIDWHVDRAKSCEGIAH